MFPPRVLENPIRRRFVPATLPGRLHRLTAAIPAAVLAALLVFPPAVPAAPHPFFGACGADAADLNGVNMKIARLTIDWAAVQPANGGAYDWNAAGNDAKDAVVGGLLDASKDVLLIAGAQWPKWTGSDPDVTTDPPTAAQVATFVKAAAQHYYGLRSKKIYMEIMNEPNVRLGSDSASATLYKNILAQSKTQIRSVLTASQVAIVGVVLAGSPWMQNASDVHAFWDFITTGTNPVQNNMDILSYHPYTIPALADPDVPPEVGHARGGPLLTKLTNSKTKIDATGFSGAVWASEGGWPTQAGEKNPVTEAQQARWLVRMAIIIRGFGLNRFTMFRYVDTPTLSYGLVNEGGAPKTSYNAYKTMCGVLDSTSNSLVKQLYSETGVCQYKYTKTNGDYGYVIWRVPETGTTTVGVAVGTNGHVYKKTLSQTGSWTDLGVHSGTYNVTGVGANPVYIEVR